MGAFLAYTIKVAICLLFLFAFTKLVFGKDTLHAFNRAVWLLIVPASLLLPLCDLSLWQYLDSGNFAVEEPMEQEAASYSAEAAAVPVAQDNTLLPLVRWAAAVYFAGVLAMALYFIVFYIRLFRLILPKHNDLCRRLTLQGSSSLVVPKVDMESNRKTMQGSSMDAAADFLELLQLCKGQVRFYGKVHFIVHEKEIAPFSWMNYVVVSEKDVLEDGRAILIHELSHVKEGHSWDILLMSRS